MELRVHYDPLTRAFTSVTMDGKTLANVGSVSLTAGGSAVLDRDGNTLFAAEAGGVYDRVPGVAKAAQDIADFFGVDERTTAHDSDEADPLFSPCDRPRGQ